MARAVSALTFPLLMPTYAVLMVFLLSFMNMYDAKILVTVAIVTFLVTAIMPAIAIYILYQLGAVTDPALNKRTERLIPFVVTILAYLATAIYYTRIHAPHWMSAFMFGASIALAIALAINLKWKISGHTMGMGGLTALALFMACHDYLVHGDYLLPMCLLLLTGLVGTCRLLLGRHTLGQVGAGFALGFIAIYLSMSL